MRRNIRVLSFDPGYERLGVAVLERNSGTDSVIYSACIQTPAKTAFPERLLLLGKEVERLIKTYAPSTCALETLFLSKNQKTAMRVAEVRGMLIFLAVQSDLSVYEYTPLQVKSAISGFGRSDKGQVSRMIEKLVKIQHKIKYDDEYDAIAVGLTCLASERF